MSVLCFGKNRANFPNPHQVAGVSLSWENKMTYQQDNTYTGNEKAMGALHRKITQDTMHDFHSSHINKKSSVETIPHNANFFL